MNTNETQNAETVETIAAGYGWTVEGARAFLATGLPLEDLADILDHLNRETDGEGSTDADVALAILNNNWGHASALEDFQRGWYYLYDAANEEEAGAQLAEELADTDGFFDLMETNGFDRLAACIDWATVYHRETRHGFTAYRLGNAGYGLTWFAFVPA